MSFLTIPAPEGLFTSIRTNRAPEEGNGNSPEDEDDDDDSQNIRLIPRCSPIPRKRGQSIFDEDEEYMRIRLGLVLPARRVSFADTTGGDLVDVKEFVAFDSDEDDSSWEAEQEKYRRPHREPIYRVSPEFDMPTPSALTHAVHTNKIEVEMVSPLEDEPLAFSGIVRVLNISFNKAVHIRSTMDSWGTYFDYPTEYIQGSHDGETDKFSFKLSFAPPYLTHGSRIEFVVRFETPDGDYWANNNGRNYVVTLLLSYHDELAQASGFDMQDIKGILKPGRIYSMGDDFEENFDKEEGEPECYLAAPEVVRPAPICPVIIQPEIDVETLDDTPRYSLPLNPDLPPADGTLPSSIVSLGEQSSDVSSTATPSTNEEPLAASQGNQALQPSEAESLMKLDFELGNQNPVLTLTDTNTTDIVTDIDTYLPHADLDDTVTNHKDPVTDPPPTVNILLCIDPSDTVSDPTDAISDLSDTVTDSTATVTAISDKVTGQRYISTVSDSTHTVTAPPHLESQVDVPSLNDTTNESDLSATPLEKTEGKAEVKEEKEEEELRPKEDKGWSTRTQLLATSSISFSKPPPDPDNFEDGAESDIEGVLQEGVTGVFEEAARKLTWLEEGLASKDMSLMAQTGPWSHRYQASGEDIPGVEPSSCMWFLPAASTHSAPAVASQTSLKDGHITAPSPGFIDSVSEGFTGIKPSWSEDPDKAIQDSHTLSLHEGGQKEESSQVTSDPLGSLSRNLRPESEPTMDRSLIQSAVFLCVAICLTLVVYQPSLFFFIGLFLFIIRF